MNCDNSLSLVLNVSKFVIGFQHFFVEIEGLSNVKEVIIINSFFLVGGDSKKRPTRGGASFGCWFSILYHQ